MGNTWHADQEKPELRPDEKPLNCPFCGSDSICTDSSHYGKPDEDGSIAWDAFTWCHDCGSKGPSAWAMIAWDENFHYDTVYEERSVVNYAIRQWNTRK
ncbi:hypothetical protein BFR69_04595 [Acinetobacter pittii]|uniref:Lar family restriction alleviation protein n=1 Tax=Acinetobacter pittii TaxID=48296 RepID=UPI0003670E55|nr:Lar family restriction alleviation protein [Acinetobacter pittii]KQF70010.1 hypothetical protein APC19_01595 [Acinetobacter pittii]MCF1279781.1 Lar family restriction alleviation protein [Acinetobacter pittii]MCK0901045.1 Lar family restriction alleviation protein [Acinetobacter pittii]MDP7846783.1 Lar family restriction alleviation protein [Acinetobacter pittii]MDP7870012.1 Lar family restriction alleviation protein [Acinetobacter pittii]